MSPTLEQGSLSMIDDEKSGEANHQTSDMPIPNSKEATHSSPSTSTSPQAAATPTARLLLIIVATCTSAFLVGLDQTIVTTAIPQITDDFQAPADVGWYGSAYLIAACAFQPIFGQLYKQFAIRTIYFGTLAVFLIGSLVCALAPTSTALIIGRAIAGFGSSGLIAGNLNIVAQTTSLEKRPMYIAWLGALLGVALVCGPLIGGAFTSRANWRWCFWINLPIDGIVFLIILSFYRPPKPQRDEQTILQRLSHLDWLGGVLILTSVIMLLLALQWGGDKYAWSDSQTIGLLVGSGVDAIAFFVWQWYRGIGALVPLYILRNRTVASTVTAAFFQSGATFVPIFYLPYWFQAVVGSSSLQSGVNLVPWMVANFIAAMTGGLIVTKTGWYNPFLLIGPAIGAIGAGLLVTLDPSISTGKCIGFQILNGAGLGLARQQYFIPPQAVLKAAEIPFAISFVLFSQNLAGSIFVSVSNSLLRNSLTSSLASDPRFAQESGNASIQTLLNAGPTDVRGLIKPDLVNDFLRFYNTALRDVWILAVPLSVLSIVAALPIKWVNLRSNKA